MSKTSLRSARSIADLGERVVLATVDIAAAPERVFDAIASEDIVQWWGDPTMYRTTRWTGDVRPGGVWRSEGVGADGVPFHVEGEYLVVERPHRLVHTWKPGWAPGDTSTVHYSLDAVDGGTRLTLRHDGFSSAETCKSHGEGWERVLGWLQRWSEPARAGASAERTYFMIRLLPPRPTFMADMSADEREMMGAHARYWRELLAAGEAVAFGPVPDANGGFGLGVLEIAASGDAARGRIAEIERNDPAVKSGRGLRYEVLPMLMAVVRAHAP